MKVILKKLTLLNFKGANNISIDFNDDITNITGDNGTFKTTTMDAFLWLLFGKDSTDRKDFEIKTLDSNNRVIEHLDHEVYGELLVDDRMITLKRCIKEKWVRKKGSEDRTFDGNETLYFYNDVPLQAKEYLEKINGIVNESMFKLLTSTTYFNQLEWKKRRFCLMQVAGEIDEMQIIGNNKDFLSVVVMQQEQNVTLDQLKTSIAAKKKKLKDELDQITPRIEEVNRATPEAPDYDKINARIEVLEGEINEIEQKLSDSTKISKQALQAKEKRQNDIFALQSRLNKIEFEEKTKIQNLANEKTSDVNKIKNDIILKERDITTIETRIKNNIAKIDTLKKSMDALRKKYDTESAKVLEFDKSKFSCPTCKREYDADNIEKAKEEMTVNFNNAKIKAVEEINREGKTLKVQSDNLTKENDADKIKIDAIKKEIETLKGQIPTDTEKVELPKIEDLLAANTEYQEKKKEIEKLQNFKEKPLSDTKDLEAKKKEITGLLDIEKGKLAVKDIIEKNQQRIKELLEREGFLSQEISGLEKTEFSIAGYIKSKCDIITERVNGMFSLVKFKLFNILINGGFEESCDTIINGVPYSDANTGSKINAGIDIINTLSDHYKIYVPCFLDNAEVISKPLPMKCQTIKLTKVEGLEKLQVN